jgi:hypothetical protein
VRWSLPGFWRPEIATADGGVIATEFDSNWNPIVAVTFDQNGNATGQMAVLPTHSWTENAYVVGSIDQINSTGIAFALSFSPFVYGSPSRNGTAVRMVRAPVFIPFAINASGDNNLDLYQILPGQRQFITNYFNASVTYLNPAQVAVYDLPLERATAARFLGALGTANSIVGYIDHGLIVPGQTNARALCFWRTCLAPSALATWAPQRPGDPGMLYSPAGTQLATLSDGFTPKATVVFLAACGIDQAFIDQWHLQAGQALIVPQYNSPDMHLNLNNAANEFEAMLLKLGKGRPVIDTVDFGNQQAKRNGSLYSWRFIGDPNASFNPKTK